MKRLFVNQKIIVLIFTVMLLIYGVQGMSYGQGGAPTVTPGDTNTSLRVSFIDVLYTFDENAYQIQLRRKIPQGNWITNCVDISYRDRGGRSIEIYTYFHDLEPGVTYEARYRDTNESDCTENPPSPDPWSAISEGTTILTTPPLADFVDDTLARAIRWTLDLDIADGVGVEILKIPVSQLTRLTELNMRDRTVRDLTDDETVRDLTGLEHATQLLKLYLTRNDISDISPLAGLTELRELWLSANEISDISPLAGLTELRELWLNANEISDISPLAGLTQLRELGLPFNRISDISPLSELIELTTLTLNTNQISDITPLTQLTKLTLLSLTVNQIRDLSPLATLTQLTTLDLASNQISDVTPLAQLSESLEELDLQDNRIRDVTPLASLIYLEKLSLKDNPITDTFPLSTLLDENPDLDIDIAVIREAGGPTLAVSTFRPLTVATLNGDIVTLKLSSGEFGLRTDIHDALTISGITGVTFHWRDIDRVSNTEITIQLTFTGSINTDSKLIFTLGPGGIRNYNGPALTAEIPVPVTALDENPDLDIDIEVIRETGGPTLTLSTFRPLTVATLNGDIVTLKLSSGEFGLRTDIRDALTISGITGVTFHWSDIDRVSATEITIQLTFTGSINTDSKLIFTLGPGGIRNYNGPALTAEIPVPVTAEVEALIASTPVPLTAANLHGSVVTLTLGEERYDINWNWVSQNVTVSGIDGVTFKRHNVERINDIQVTIPLEFDGNLDTDSTLTFTVGAKAIANYDGPALTAELPVTVSATTETPTTDATISITPPSIASPAVGEQLDFSLNIAGGEAVAGYQATVQFDTTALRYVSGANGDFLPAGAFFVEPKVEGSLLKLNSASLAGESNGDGTLATLTFEVIAVKVSTLTLSDALLTNSAGDAFVPTVENAEITEAPELKGDVNGDGIVNIQDLVLVAGQLGQTGTNAADVNGDGQVNIQDLVLVAGALGTTAAAPSAHLQSLDMLTAADVKQWLSQAQQLNITDATSLRGIQFLQDLLATLTPKETVLLPNYPNPFNPETWMPYHLAKDADVALHIYTVNGALVRTLALGHQSAGMYQNRSRAAYWDGKNEFGESVASGLYFYTLTAGNFTATRKMLIRK